ncbi:cell wall-binding repeat-containing protein [Halobacillus rhizosphaerae]|uniref:cell wall-binding repeat-containing protein n=1 Tax=Halobacillus rhizosphaerae TaxID=3064889 RepID=UPI00398B3597
MRKLIIMLFLSLFILPFSRIQTVGAAGADPTILSKAGNYQSVKDLLEMKDKVHSSLKMKAAILPKITALKDKLDAAEASSDTITTYGTKLEKEPNNLLEQANPLKLDDTVVGDFTFEDVDIYKLTIDKEDRIDVAAFADSKVDLGYQLFDEKGVAVDWEDYYYEDHSYMQAYTVHPGTYYIAAVDFNGGGTDGAYVLSPFSEDDSYQKEAIRINGSDRYKTAVEIARNGWPEGADTIILARDFNFPDALAGAPLAYKIDAPILLNPKDKLHQDVKKALREFGAEKVIILGGPGAISPKVMNELKNEYDIKVKRIGGTNRYETAAEIAKELGYYDSAVLASGSSFPDALSAGSYAATHGMPILLTEKNNLPIAAKSALEEVDDTIIVGGTGVISNHVEASVKSHHPIRIAGKTRYETSVNLVRELGLDPFFMTIATGENYADALTGSVLAAKWGEPMVLVKKNEIPKEVQALIDENGTSYFTILGGTGAVSEKVENELLQ